MSESDGASRHRSISSPHPGAMRSIVDRVWAQTMSTNSSIEGWLIPNIRKFEMIWGMSDKIEHAPDQRWHHNRVDQNQVADVGKEL